MAVVVGSSQNWNEWPTSEELEAVKRTFSMGQRHARNEHDGSNRGDGHTDQDSKRFACPFFVHDPKKYRQHRVCSGPGFNSVHRVKEHLYRKHRLPNLRCHRCGQASENEVMFREHVAAGACPVEPLEDGIDADQEAQLKSRVKSGQPMSETQKWQWIYKIIFPDVNDIPSPFYDLIVDHDDANSPPRQNSEAAYHESSKLQLFACPFMASDAVRWHCPGMKRLADVRQHIKRSHTDNMRCVACGRLFMCDKDRNSHSCESACGTTTFQPELSALSWSQLEQRFRKGQQNKEEGWYVMWDTIFPQENRPKSPYINGSTRLMWLDSIAGRLKTSKRLTDLVTAQISGEHDGSQILLYNSLMNFLQTLLPSFAREEEARYRDLLGPDNLSGPPVPQAPLLSSKSGSSNMAIHSPETSTSVDFTSTKPPLHSDDFCGWPKYQLSDTSTSNSLRDSEIPLPKPPPLKAGSSSAMVVEESRDTTSSYIDVREDRMVLDGPKRTCYFKDEVVDNCYESRFYARALQHYLLDLDGGTTLLVQCPMINCPGVFPDAKNMLRHLKHCDSFPRGLYLCPTCNVVETFKTASEEKCSWKGINSSKAAQKITRDLSEAKTSARYPKCQYIYPLTKVSQDDLTGYQEMVLGQQQSCAIYVPQNSPHELNLDEIISPLPPLNFESMPDFSSSTISNHMEAPSLLNYEPADIPSLPRSPMWPPVSDLSTNEQQTPDLHCPKCSFVPQGKPENLQSYLRKHLRTHNETRFKCQFEGCEKVFTRQDNMTLHFKRTHPEVNRESATSAGRKLRRTRRSHLQPGLRRPQEGGDAIEGEL